MKRTWRSRFALPAQTTTVGAVASLVLVVLGLVLSAGDLRFGFFPWATGFAALGLVLCAFGLIQAHSPDPGWWVLGGGWWTALALAGLAGAFLSFGVGDLLRLEESDVGVLAYPPFLAASFGILSMSPALLMLSVGLWRANVLPRWGALAVASLVPVLPLMMILGGEAEGSAEDIALAASLGGFALGWVVLGVSASHASDISSQQHLPSSITRS